MQPVWVLNQHLYDIGETHQNLLLQAGELQPDALNNAYRLPSLLRQSVVLKAGLFEVSFNGVESFIRSCGLKYFPMFRELLKDLNTPAALNFDALLEAASRQVIDLMFDRLQGEKLKQAREQVTDLDEQLKGLVNEVFLEAENFFINATVAQGT